MKGTAPLQVLDRAKNLAVPRHVVNDNIKKATERDQADFTEVSTSQRRFAQHHATISSIHCAGGV